MLRFLLFSMSLLGFVTLASAQKFVLEISPEFKMPGKQVFQKHLFSDESGHYVYFHRFSSMLGALGGGKSSLLFEKYSPEYKLLIGKEFLADRQNVNSLGVKYLKGQFAWMVSEKNSKDDFIQFSVIPISLAGVAGDPVNLAKMHYENRRDMPETEWMTSRDSSQLLFLAYADKNKKDLNFELFLAVLDNDLNLKWDNQYKLDYSEEEVSVESVAVSNEGTVFVLAKIYEGKAKETVKKGGDKVANYKMKILQFEKDAEAPREFELNLPGVFVKSSTVDLTPQGELAVAGFFSNDNKGLIQGVYLMKMNPADGAISMARKKAFSAKELDRIGNRNVDKKKGEEGLEATFKFKEVLFSETGNMFITAEQNYRYEVVTVSANGSINSRTMYASNNIVLLNFNAEGDLETMRIIPKKQSQGTTLFLGHVAISGKEKAYFFYNDSKQNMKKPIVGDKAPASVNFKQAIAVVTSVDQNGKMERTPLYKSKEMKSLLVPKMSSALNDNSLFFVSMKYSVLMKSNFRMGRVVIQE